MNKCKIIAEIGWNFISDLNLAFKMIEAAAESGADFAKFQTWSVKNLNSGPWDNDGRRQIYESAELSDDDHLKLIKHCEKNKINFLTSVFSFEDATRVCKILDKKDYIKIPSPEITNIKMLELVNDNFSNVFLSTGGANFTEIENAVKTLKNTKIYLLHCVSCYPCKFENVNLPRIKKLKENFKLSVGYSGHSLGINDAIASLEYNVEVIEKHFTIDNDLPGRDNKFAILPQELKKLSDYINNRISMNIENESEYQSCEAEIRTTYRGRWEKK